MELNFREGARRGGKVALEVTKELAKAGAADLTLKVAEKIFKGMF